MGAKFIGRWADRTASRRLCRPYAVLFCLVPIPSIMIFTLLKLEPQLIEQISAFLAGGAETALHVFDAIALPRSLSELPVIEDRLGSPFVQAAFLAETALAIGGACAVVATLKGVNFSRVDDNFSLGQFLIRTLLVFFFLIFRPVSFTDTYIMTNYVDGSGVSLLKEAVLIAAGYYTLAEILVDVFGRASHRLRKPIVDRQRGTIAPQEIKER